MNAIGVVREYHPGQGWGVIDADTVPGGCWVHFSTLDVPGHRALTRGEVVSFVAEPARQDGYAYRAVRVWRGAGEPTGGIAPASVAYRSELTIVVDAPPGS
ncbi:cold shock domain-containing protein [Micromonospora sp. DT178]|uniref:cold shock domain-containing protein n=1 Tax=Micromonospora sp. DT178 TaxID=3393436 RepID=UPI003CE8F05C